MTSWVWVLGGTALICTVAFIIFAIQDQRRNR